MRLVDQFANALFDLGCRDKEVAAQAIADVRVVKQLYTKAVRRHPPEGDPEKFQIVRDAYETALEYHQRKQKQPPIVDYLRKFKYTSPRWADPDYGGPDNV